jgi:chondroitin 4-sulfotransferase 11
MGLSMFDMKTLPSVVQDRLRRMLYGNHLSGDIVAMHRYRTLYFPIPKVACTSLTTLCAKILREELGDLYCEDWVPRPFRDPRARIILKRRRILINPWDLKKYRDYFKFAVVRNPYDRLVSCYENRIKKTPDFNACGTKDGVANELHRYGGFYANMGFREFALRIAEISDDQADNHFRSQSLLIHSRSGEKVVDYLGRFEDLDAVFKEVFVDRVQATGLDLPHLMKSKHRPYVSYYDRDLEEVVRGRYTDDLSKLGYGPLNLEESTQDDPASATGSA